MFANKVKKIINFDILRTVLRGIFVYQKPTRCTISQLYFDIQLYMFRKDLLSIIRSLDTIYVDCLLADSQHK